MTNETVPSQRRRRPGRRFAGAASIAVLLAVCGTLTACSTPTPPPSDDANVFLLIANYSGHHIEVLSAVDDPAALQHDTGAGFTTEDDASVAMAVFGPDGRIYVADHGVGRILVYDADAAFAASAPAPVAVITSADIIEPVALAFNAAGELWVVDRRRSSEGDPHANRLVKLHSAGTAVGPTDLDGTTVVEFDDAASPDFKYDQLGGLFIDQTGNIWVTDVLNWNVARIDDPDGLLGVVLGVVPDLQFKSVDFAAPDDSAIRNPTSLAMDADGRLYIGNRGQTSVARFDDPYAVTNNALSVAPSAVIVSGLPNTTLVAVDGDGALWVASSGPADPATIARFANPGSGMGLQTPAASTTFAWAPANAYAAGGGMLFHTR